MPDPDASADASQGICPLPTKPDGDSRCVLTADAVLTQTLELPTGVTLNCQGHSLLPMQESGSSPSVPVLAIAVIDQRDTRIEGCVIGTAASRFDLGIVIIDAKNAGAHAQPAIGTIGTYTIASQLSWNGIGNYWGHAAPPCFEATDSANAMLVKDDAASCTAFQP